MRKLTQGVHHSAIESCEDSRIRLTMDPGPGYFRPITEQRKVGINQIL